MGREKIFAAGLALLFAGLLSGCGAVGREAGSEATMDHAAGATGNAVSTTEGAVSTSGTPGSIAREVDIDEEVPIYAGKISMIEDHYQNSTNIYKESEDHDFVILQAKRNGSGEKQIKVPARGAGYMKLLYADDEYLYYCRGYDYEDLVVDPDDENDEGYWDGDYEAVLWRVPIKKVKGTDEVLIDKEEKLFSKMMLYEIMVQDGMIYVDAEESHGEWAATLYDTHTKKFIHLEAEGAVMSDSNWEGITKEGGILRASKYGEADVDMIYLVDRKTHKLKKLLTGDEDYLEVACNKRAAFLTEGHEVWIAHDGIVESYITEEDIQKEVDSVLKTLKEKGKIKEDQKVEWDIVEVDLESRSRLEIDVSIAPVGDYALSCSLTAHPGDWRTRKLMKTG